MTALPADQTPDDDITPAARAYLAAHPDRVFAGWQFLRWMFEQRCAWFAETGAHPNRPMTTEQHEAFVAWLEDRWGTSSGSGGNGFRPPALDGAHHQPSPPAAANLRNGPPTAPTPSGLVGLSPAVSPNRAVPSTGREAHNGGGELGGSEGSHAPPAATPSLSDCVCGHGPMVHARYGCCTAVGCRCDRLRKRRHYTNEAAGSAKPTAS